MAMAVAGLLARMLASVPGPRYVLRCGATCSLEKCFSKYISSNSQPKHPLTAYIRFYKEQYLNYQKQYPDLKMQDILRKVAQAWRELPASDKQSYEAAAKAERERYKEQMAKHQSELTPVQKAALKKEKRKKTKELTLLGKPKRFRSAFNMFLSEHFQEAKGTLAKEKMKTLCEQWQSMTSSQKQIYLQLAEDDKIRYENEMRSWEEQMKEIGRKDLIHSKTRKGMSVQKKL